MKTEHMRNDTVLKTVIVLGLAVLLIGVASAAVEPDTTPLTEDCNAQQYLGGDGNCYSDSDHHDDPGDHAASSNVDLNGNNLVSSSNGMQLDFDENTRDKALWYGTSYTTGVESSTMYWESSSMFRWYANGVGNDGGTSDHMQLDASHLSLNGVNLDANSNNLQDVSNIYSDDSSTDFFGDCGGSDSYVYSINSDGSVNCAGDSDHHDDPGDHAASSDIDVSNNGVLNIGELGDTDIGNVTGINGINDANAVGMKTHWDTDLAFFGLRDYGSDSKDVVINNEQTSDNIRLQSDGNDRLIAYGSGNVEIPSGNLDLSDGNLNDVDNINQDGGDFFDDCGGSGSYIYSINSDGSVNCATDDDTAHHDDPGDHTASSSIDAGANNLSNVRKLNLNNHEWSHFPCSDNDAVAGSIFYDRSEGIAYCRQGNIEELIYNVGAGSGLGGGVGTSSTSGSLSVNAGQGLSISSDSVDINAGNALSIASDTLDVDEGSINHNNLVNSGQSDAHHTRYSDSEARSALEAGNVGQIDFTNNLRINEDGTGHADFRDRTGGRADIEVNRIYLGNNVGWFDGSGDQIQDNTLDSSEIQNSADFTFNGDLKLGHGEGLLMTDGGDMAGVSGNDAREIRIQDSNTPRSPDGALVITSGNESTKLMEFHDGGITAHSTLDVNGNNINNIGGLQSCNNQQYVGGDGNCYSDSDHHDDPGDHAASSNVDMSGNDITGAHDIYSQSGGRVLLRAQGSGGTLGWYDDNNNVWVQEYNNGGDINLRPPGNEIWLNDNYLRDANRVYTDNIYAGDGNSGRIDMHNNVDLNGNEMYTGGATLDLDGGDQYITIHDGNGNYNIKSGVDPSHTIVAGSGGTHVRLDESGGFDVSVDESTAGGNAFSEDFGFGLNGGEVDIRSANLNMNSGNILNGKVCPDGTCDVNNYETFTASGVGASNIYDGGGGEIDIQSQLMLNGNNVEGIAAMGDQGRNRRIVFNDNGNLNFYNSTGSAVASITDGAPGELDMKGNDLTSVDDVKFTSGANPALVTPGGGNDFIGVYDQANGNFMATFNEGGNVEIRNGDLKVDGGVQIGGVETRRILGSDTDTDDTTTLNLDVPLSDPNVDAVEVVITHNGAGSGTVDIIDMQINGDNGNNYDYNSLESATLSQTTGYSRFRWQTWTSNTEKFRFRLTRGDSQVFIKQISGSADNRDMIVSGDWNPPSDPPTLDSINITTNHNAAGKAYVVGVDSTL